MHLAHIVFINSLVMINVLFGTHWPFMFLLELWLWLMFILKHIWPWIWLTFMLKWAQSLIEILGFAIVITIATKIQLHATLHRQHVCTIVIYVFIHTY